MRYARGAMPVICRFAPENVTGVFALHATPEGTIAVYVPDMLDDAIRAKLVAPNADAETEHLLQGKSPLARWRAGAFAEIEDALLL